MKKSYKMEKVGNKTIYINLADNTKIEVDSYENKNMFDVVKISKKYDMNFIDYVINNSKNDIGEFQVLYENKELDDLLHSKNFRISTYEYLLKYNYKELKRYNTYYELDDNAKKYYLKKLNDAAKRNVKYYNPKEKFITIGDDYLIEGYRYVICKNDNEIIGMLDYKLDDEIMYVRNLFSNDEDVSYYMIDHLFHKNKKNIIINISYTDEFVLKVIKNMNGILREINYVNIDALNSAR